MENIEKINKQVIFVSIGKQISTSITRNDDIITSSDTNHIGIVFTLPPPKKSSIKTILPLLKHLSTSDSAPDSD